MFDRGSIGIERALKYQRRKYLMMEGNKMKRVAVSLVMVLGLLLAACSPAATPAPTSPPQQPQATVPSVPTAPPAGAPVNWENVDPTGQTVVFWHVYSKAQGDALK